MSVLPRNFTEGDRESLAIFSRLLDLQFADRRATVVLITKAPFPHLWGTSENHVVNLAHGCIMDLIRSDKVRLEAEGAYTGLLYEPWWGVHRHLAAHLKKQGFYFNHPTRGRQDNFAYQLLRQQYRLATPRGALSRPTPASTFTTTHPDEFCVMSDAAREFVCLFKEVIVGLGGHGQRAVTLLVNTTQADTRRWPASSVKAVTLAQGFVRDQIDHNRVILVPRPKHLESDYGSFDIAPGPERPPFGNGPMHRAEHIPSTWQTIGLPETFVDLVVSLFAPDDVDSDVSTKNHIVDIARISMELTGNQPMPARSM